MSNGPIGAAVDVVSVGVVVATLAKILPAIAALFSIVWTCIRIYETRTVQGMLARCRKRKKQRGSTPTAS